MSAHANPDIVTDGLVLCVDAADKKSLLAPPTINLANNSNGTINWTIGNIGAGGATQSTVNANDYHYRLVLDKGSYSYIAFRVAFDHTNLTDGETYIISYKYKIISGSGTFQVFDFCDQVITRVTEDIGDGWYYETAYGSKSSYSETYDFFDFRALDNMTVDIKEIQVEHTSASSPSATPFVSYQRQWKDRSGNSNNGTFTNGPTFDSSNGGSIAFDGVNDRVVISNSASLNPTAGLTIESWVNFDANSGDFIFEKGDVNTQFSLFSHGTDIVFRTFHDADSTVNTIATSKSNAGIVNGQWHHIVASWDGSTKKIYVDGMEKSSANKTGALITRTTDAAIGTFGTAATYPIGGKIAAVRLYSKGLTASEVLRNYNATKSKFGL